jgi:tRNA nucleotidyltransferase (CCA-adding enzyme)
MVITDKLNPAVKQFVALYRDQLDLVLDHQVPWDDVTQAIVVDVAALSRLGNGAAHLGTKHIPFIVYDHHPAEPGDIEPQGVGSRRAIEAVGATVTMLIEEIQAQGLTVTSFEATLLGLGLYSDTGSFRYSNTTPRDLAAASWLLHQGMDLALINRFEEATDEPEDRQLLRQLLLHAEEISIDGLTVVVTTYAQDNFLSGLSTQARKLLETTEADGVLIVARMKNRVYIVGRAASNRINFIPLISQFGGGGHAKAASAQVKNGSLEEIFTNVQAYLPLIVTAAVHACDIMSTPVLTIAPDLKVEEASKLLSLHGHSGFPIVTDDQLIGVISRRDLDKIIAQGLGHAPVKAFMQKKVVYVHPNTPIEQLLDVMTKHDIGRLPVMDHGVIVGIVTRSDVIRVLHKL